MTKEQKTYRKDSGVNLFIFPGVVDISPKRNINGKLVPLFNTLDPDNSFSQL